MTRREHVEQLLRKLVGEALADFDKSIADATGTFPMMTSEPVAVALCILWSCTPPEKPSVMLPDVVATTNTAVHKSCPLDPPTVFGLLAEALEGTVEVDGDRNAADQPPAEKPS